MSLLLSCDPNISSFFHIPSCFDGVDQHSSSENGPALSTHTHFAKHSLTERWRHFVVVPIWSWWVCNMHSSSIIYYNVLVLIIIITHTQNVVLLCPKETHLRYPINYTILICHYFVPIACYNQETVNSVEALGLHCS